MRPLDGRHRAVRRDGDRSEAEDRRGTDVDQRSSDRPGQPVEFEKRVWTLDRRPYLRTNSDIWKVVREEEPSEKLAAQSETLNVFDVHRRKVGWVLVHLFATR